MTHVWSANEKTMFLVLGIAAILAFVVVGMIVLDWIRENNELREWRAKLKRGDRVRVEGMEEVQLIWNIDGDDVIVRVFNTGRDWFKKVRLDNVWPEKETIEWEIVNE